MKLQNKQEKAVTPKILIFVVGVLVLYLVLAYIIKIFPFTPPSQPSISDDVKQSYGASSSGNTKTSDGAGLPDSSGSTTSEDVPTATNASVIIDSINQKNGFVTSNLSVSGEGTCVFLYTTPDDRPVTDQVSVSDNKCSSSVRETEFAKLGEWNLKVTFYSNGEKVEATQNVTIH